MLCTVACSTKPIKVESQPPGADIYAIQPGQTPRKLGVTPLTLDEQSIAGTPTTQISASLKGRQTQTIIVPSSAFGQTGQVTFNLQEPALPAACEKQEESLERLARGVAEAQSHLAGRKLDQAQITLNTLVGEFETVSVLHDLLGNVHYLRKDLSSALESYRRSYELNPNNSETFRMIKKIESLRGENQ